MHITQLNIKNFKTFRDVTFHFDSKLNVFAGGNNVGKTTVLEALAFWKECFSLLLYQAKRTDKDLRLKAGDFRIGDSGGRYLDYDKLYSVRLPNFSSLFHNLEKKERITLTATFQNQEKTLAIPLEIEVGTGKFYRLWFTQKGFDYSLFNDFFQKFPNPIESIFVSPFVGLLSSEDFLTRPKIQQEIQFQNSISVLRNRLYQLRKDAEKFNDFIYRLSQILLDDNQYIDLKIEGEETRDIQVRVKVKIYGQEVMKDLFLLGSGTLQLVEIILSLYTKSEDLNLILLDEPDSHIHRDLQKKLLNTLSHFSNEQTQVFLTTHNESLIRSIPPQNLFNLEQKTSGEYSPIHFDSSEKKKKGLQPTPHMKVLPSLGNENSLDFLNALEAESLLFVEGQDDALYLQTILERKTINHRPNMMYWAFDGIDNIITKLKFYEDFFKEVGNGKKLWDKVVLVFDRDYLTDEQRETLMQEIQKKCGISTYIWSAYTLEGNFLTDLEKLSLLLAQYFSKQHRLIVQTELLREALEKRVQEKIQEKLEEWSKPDFSKRLFHLLKGRKEKLEQKLLIKNVLRGGLGDLVPNYRAFSEERLKQGDLSHIATKKDMQWILEGLYHEFGPEPSLLREQTTDHPLKKENIFYSLLQNSSLQTWFTEWRNMTDSLGL